MSYRVKTNKKNTGSVLNFDTRKDVVKFVKDANISLKNIVVRRTQTLGYGMLKAGNNIAKSIYNEAHK